MGRHQKTNDQDSEDPKEPTNPDFWGEDKFYDTDTDKGGGFRIAGAVAFCLVIVVTATGLGHIFGVGNVSGPPEKVWMTTESTVTDAVTVKSQKTKTVTKEVTKTPSQATKTPPGPTVYRTTVPHLMPRPTVTRTVKVTRIPDPITVTRTIRVKITIFDDSGLSDGF